MAPVHCGGTHTNLEYVTVACPQADRVCCGDVANAPHMKHASASVDVRTKVELPQRISQRRTQVAKERCGGRVLWNRAEAELRAEDWSAAPGVDDPACDQCLPSG